jgi:hypothetical protein
MEPESALRAWAIADPTLAGLIGVKFHPLVVPQQTPGAPSVLPCCTYARVSRSRPDEIQFATVRIQVTCWAATATEARAVATALTSAAGKRKGTSAGLRVVYCSEVNDLDLRDPDTGRFTVPVDFKLTYQET